MSVDQYLKKFSRLNTDKSRHLCSAATQHRAPHKPSLLLSIMDLIIEEQIVENFIEPSFELDGAWAGVALTAEFATKKNYDDRYPRDRSIFGTV